MGFNLLDDRFKFYGLFAGHCGLLNEAARILASIFHDPAAVADRCKRIQDIEIQSRGISREINLQLSLTMIRQMERADIHDLDIAFKSAITALKAVSTRIGLYDMGHIKEAARELADNLVELAVIVDEMLKKLPARQRAGDSAENLEKILRESGVFLLLGLGEIYEAGQQQTEPVMEVIKWSQIFDRIEEAIRRTEDVAQGIDALLLKLF